MKFEIINNIDSLKKYKDDWSKILKENHNNIPFLEIDYILKWWKYFGKNKKMFVLIVRSNGIIAGFCPLMITKRFFWNEINFIGFPQANYMDLILLEKYRADSIKMIIDYLIICPEASMINFHGILKSSKNFKLLNEYFSKKNIKLFANYAPVPYIKITNSNFKEYIKNNNKKDKKKIMKRKDRLKQLGELDFKLLDSENICEIFRLHNNRWRKKIDTSNINTPKMKGFLTDLVKDKKMSFLTEIDVFTLNNRVLAFIYGFKYNKRYMQYMVGHDESFSFYGIGKMINLEKIKECFINNTINSSIIYDFSIGYEEYKLLFTNTMDFVYKIIFPSKKISSLLIFALVFAKEKSTILAKKNRKIVLFKRNTLGKIKYLFSHDNLISAKKELLYKLEHDGINIFLMHPINKFINFFYYNVQYTIFTKNNIFNNGETIEHNYDIERMSINNLDELATALHKKKKEIVMHFYKRQTCFKISIEGKVLSYAWVDYSEIFIKDINYTKPIKDKEAFIFKLTNVMNDEMNFNYVNIIITLSNFLLEDYCNTIYYAEDNIHRKNSLIYADFHPYYTINFNRKFLKGTEILIKDSGGVE